MVGAVLPFTLVAQQGGAKPRPAAGDTLRMEVSSGSKADTGKTKAATDSAARAAFLADSLEKFKAGDTVRAPFARAESPRTTDIGAPYEWNRDQLMSSGAQTLADLLDRVPGASGFRTAWLIDQQSSSYLGDFARVRLFVDGLPFAPPDRDGRSALDLTAIQLWAFEHCRVERSGEELRVYLRSWRYDKTIPQSRVDVFTGDQDANTFRGFFAQRFGPGLGVQAAGENLSLSNTRTGGDGSRRAGMVRLGWARGSWSVDITHQFVDNNRNAQSRLVSFTNLPALDAAASLGYARVAWGDPEQGTWVQAMAATEAFASLSSALNATTNDSNRVFDRRDAIYALQAGSEWNGLRLSGGMRWTSRSNLGYTSPQLRLSYDRRWVTVAAYAERATDQSTSRADVSLRLLPRPWLAVAGSYGRMSVGNDRGQSIKGFGWRGELGIRVRDELWLTGGVIGRDSAFVRAPARFDSTLTNALTPSAQGTFVGLRGRVYSDIFADIVATSWDKTGLYRPRYQTRSELFLQTRWLSRFPSGVFGLLMSVAHEYREPVAFVAGSNALASKYGRTVNAKLEIRIMSGVLSYRILNLAGDQYTQIPGAQMVRSVSVYGIRWDFRN